MVAQLFTLGRLVITAHAQAKLDSNDVLEAVRRHSSGDWGDLCQEDLEENQLALKEGFRLFSVYQDRNKIRFWIITEADRSATTVLLPEDY